MMKRADTDRQSLSGFTLVELSIVLAIIGLLLGGVLVGQSLIRAAELRNVPAEYQKYQTAVNTFNNRYRAKPGDMRNATRFWGAADTSNAGECAHPLTDLGTGTQTCNGNGNGLSGEDYEQLRFWQHLSNAGLIEGRFTGVQSGSTYLAHVIDENAPGSKIPGAGWAAVHLTVNTEPFKWNVRDVRYQTAFLGGQSTGGRYPDAPIFTAEELLVIDQKMDDGKPGSGLLRTQAFDTCTDAVSRDDAASANYDVNSETRCAAIFHDMY